MFLFAQAVHFIIQPWHFFLLLIGFGFALRALRFMRAGRISFWAAGGFLALVSLTPIADSLAYTLEGRIQPGQYDLDEVAGAIVLGGSTGSSTLAEDRGGYLLTGASERLNAIASLRRRRPDVPILVTGNADEAEMTRAFLTDIGIDPDTIMFEDQSRNTYENAQFSADMLADRPGAYLLVTSARHMPRAVGCFRRAGVTVIPYPVDYRAERPSWSVARMNPTDRFELLDDMIDEVVGLVVYRMLGRTDSLFPDD